MNLHVELAANFPFVTYLDDVQLSDRLRDGRISFALVVACCDMGANLPFLCKDPKANILIFQDLGHRSSQFGISSLLAKGNVDHLVIYGHSDCEFTRFLVRTREDHIGFDLLAKSFKAESLSALRQYGRNLTKDDHTNWRRLNEWSVLAELKSALLYPGVFERAEQLQLELHGWLYVAEENRLFVFEPNEAKFVPARACFRVEPGPAIKELPAYSSRQPDGY